METVGIYFRKKIKERLAKPSAVAEKIGMTPNKLSAVLNGRRKLAALEFFDLCKALGIDPCEAMEEITGESYTTSIAN